MEEERKEKDKEEGWRGRVMERWKKARTRGNRKRMEGWREERKEEGMEDG